MVTEFRWRVNLLCLVGAVIGAVSIFLVWLSLTLAFFHISDLNLIDLLNESLDSSSGEGTQILIACILILVGVIIAFLSPIGGILELSGASLFLEWFLSETGGEFPSGPGVYVAIASGIIVIISAFMPIGLGYGRGPGGLKGRILTFSS